MTEENDLTTPSFNQENTVKIYSKRASWRFSVFFSPVFGGFLLRQNLINSGRKKEANLILLISIVFTVATILIVNNFHTKGGSFSYLFNMVWGAILSEYFFKKYFPSDNYEYKKIWKALIISIAITAPFLLAMIFAPAG
ncbi:hypothetical protein [Dyadobacter chenhuakuii]|uniref:Uncharacterized protein n=1 Tax=Dyadobacter chenhuakuii TaxID=2909339 RepID=A0ABY4XPW5_9BACT|nr:hypothetical protein [Dyadobacter chenhuakuii]MCF2494413.1 hypothetical protein [Dyadobacter chenhuakuii]USJ32261.1 hypothetical protein NFI80_05855 [Dyadobacter chenhuakuii]